jgi:hypothetical protein
VDCGSSNGGAVRGGEFFITMEEVSKQDLNVRYLGCGDRYEVGLHGCQIGNRLRVIDSRTNGITMAYRPVRPDHRSGPTVGRKVKHNNGNRIPEGLSTAMSVKWQLTLHKLKKTLSCRRPEQDLCIQLQCRHPLRNFP